MNYCLRCGSGGISRRIPAMDTRERYLCDACGYIHYENPRIIAGCIPVWQDGRIMLCRRAIEPSYGLWTLPAGFMELDETVAEAAARETLEEAGARVQVEALFAMFNLPHVNQVYLMHRARLLDTAVAPGEESLEVALFRAQDIPWSELAFASIHYTLELYLQQDGAMTDSVHVGDVIRRSGHYTLLRADGSSVGKPVARRK